MPELVVGQAGKELTHNQALAVLDQLAQAVVVDKDLTAPPGSPSNGSMYIVATSATGDWSGQDGKLAYWLTTVAAWTFITPADGWSVWVTDEAVRYERKSGAWVVASGGAGMANPMTTLGDIIVAGNSGIPARLAKGSPLQVLRINAAGDAHEYADPSTSSAPVQAVAVSAGVLNLSAVSVDTVTVLLNQNVTSITLPSGVAGQRRDLLIEFTQDATGGRTVEGWPVGTWDAAPTLAAAPAAATLVGLMSIDGGAMVGIPQSSGGGAWGEITGTLADQADLLAALNAKATSTQGSKADTAVQPNSQLAMKVNAVIEKSSGGVWQVSSGFANAGIASVAVQGSGITATIRCTLAPSLSCNNFLVGLVGAAAVSNALKVSASFNGPPATYIDLVFGNGSARVDPTTDSVPNATYYMVWGS